MSAIQLSSYERVRRYIAPDNKTPKTDELSLRREITNWIQTISRQIERFLGRELLIDTYTEYFDVEYQQRAYYPKGWPVTSITSVKEDSSGQWDGTSESTLGTDEYFIGRLGQTIQLLAPLPYNNLPKGLQAVYVGGLANHGTRSQFTVTTGTDFTVGKFLQGDTSLALGIIRATAATSITVENLYGIFELEGITQYDTGDATDDATTPGGAGNTDTISAIAQQSLAESEYGDLVRAAEIQIRFDLKHKLDFEAVGVTKDNVNLRRRDHTLDLPFTEEAIALLLPYRHVNL